MTSQFGCFHHWSHFQWLKISVWASPPCQGIELDDFHGTITWARIWKNSLVLGDGRPPTFNRESLFHGYLNPYYWVEFPIPYGNNPKGSTLRIQPAVCSIHGLMVCLLWKIQVTGLDASIGDRRNWRIFVIYVDFSAQSFGCVMCLLNHINWRNQIQCLGYLLTWHPRRQNALLTWSTAETFK